MENILKHYRDQWDADSGGTPVPPITADPALRNELHRP